MYTYTVFTCISGSVHVHVHALCSSGSVHSTCTYAVFMYFW